MTIDLSSINSIYSLLGTSTSANTQTKPTANFEDYLMDALNPVNKKDKNSNNGLYDFMANTGNTNVLNGLMDSGNGLTAIGGYDAYMALMGNSNDTSINPYGTAASVNKDAFSDYLQSSFQATMMKNMNAAKAKLQISYEDYVAKIGDNPNEAATFRKAQMEQNIAMVSDFIAGKTPSVGNTEKELLDLLGGNNVSVNTSDLLNQLKGNSTLLDWLTKSSNNTSSNPQDLLNQLTASGNYYQNLLNS